MTITTLATRYNDFRDAFGKHVSADYDGIVEDLFAPSFTKNGNGIREVSERGQILDRLRKVREKAGSWEIKIQEIIPSIDNTQCVLRYVLTTVQAGDFGAIVILTSLSGEQIESVEEIYYQITPA